MTTPQLTLCFRLGTRDVVRVIKLTHPGNFVSARITEDGEFEYEAEHGQSDPPPPIEESNVPTPL